MLWTSLVLAMRQMQRHALRSFLTIIGVVIGVFAVVTMVTLGDGVTASVRDQISALGSNVLQMRPGQSAGPGGGGGTTGGPAFNKADVQALAEQIAGVDLVAGQVQTSGVAIRNAQNWTTSIMGVNSAYFAAQALAFSDGREFTLEEEQAGRSACVIGATIVENLFQGTEPLGETFRIRGVSCLVVGVLEERGQSGFGGDLDDAVFMPIKAVQRQMTGNQDITSIIVALDPA